MKEIISAILLIVGLYSGTLVLKGLHDLVRTVALEKAAHGMPSLIDMTRSLKKEK